MYLPAIEKRVVKMTVGALEIPLTYHAVSNNLGNNRCLIIDNCSNFYPDPNGWLLTLPDGNYGTNELRGAPGSNASTEMDIEIAMNNAIATADAGTVNINTGNFTLTGGAKLDPAQDICYRWDRISGRSVFACPENASCSSGGGGAAAAVWTDRGPTGGGPGNWGDSNTPAIASNRTGDKMWAVARFESIYRSTDYGVTWTQPYSNVRRWTSIASDSAGTNLIACVGAGGGGLERSFNSGDTWAKIFPTQGPRAWSSVASNVDGTVQVAVAVSGGNGHIDVFENFPASPTPGVSRTPGGANHYPVSIACSYDAGSGITNTKFAVTFRTNFAGGAGGVIWTSINTGVTWTERTGVPVSTNWKGICSNIDGLKIFAVLSGGNIWRSLDGGANWIELVSPNVTTPPTINLTWNDIACDDTGTNIVAGGTNTGIWISQDGGDTWSNTTYSPPTVTFSSQSVASNEDGTILAVGEALGNIWTVGAGGAGGGGTCSNMDFIVRFTIDKRGNLDMNDSIQVKLGWPLGFRGGEYMTSGAAVSEGICFITGPRYGFLAIDDFQKNRGKAHMLAFANSSLDENIMVRINLAAVQNKEGVYKSANDPGLTTTMNTSRDYFGPVDIQKIKVTLYDEYGRVMDINNMDWSFTITLERLYD